MSSRCTEQRKRYRTSCTVAVSTQPIVAMITSSAACRRVIWRMSTKFGNAVYRHRPALRTLSSCMIFTLSCSLLTRSQLLTRSHWPIYLFRPQCSSPHRWAYGRNVCRRMVVARSNCSEIVVVNAELAISCVTSAKKDMLYPAFFFSVCLCVSLSLCMLAG